MIKAREKERECTTAASAVMPRGVRTDVSGLSQRLSAARRRSAPLGQQLRQSGASGRWWGGAGGLWGVLAGATGPQGAAGQTALVGRPRLPCPFEGKEGGGGGWPEEHGLGIKREKEGEGGVREGGGEQVCFLQPL